MIRVAVHHDAISGWKIMLRQGTLPELFANTVGKQTRRVPFRTPDTAIYTGKSGNVI